MEYPVYYLGHSAWAVETARRWLFFDCQDVNAQPNGQLRDKQADLRLLDKPAYLFFSHFHHDHYSPALHKQNEERNQGLTFLGDFKAKFDATRTITLRPRQSGEWEGITVYTAASADAGVCFMVQADGLTLFFAGDHADWGDGDPKNALYYPEIDYMAGLNLPCDMAFIPVCTFSGTRPPEMTRGACYAIEKLRPAVTYPMHANGREALYAAFARDLLETGSEAKVICPPV